MTPDDTGAANLKDNKTLQVIYVPTEANLPILEATRKPHD
jgi:hypothetical protein